MSRSGDFRGDNRQTDRQTDCFTPAHVRGVIITEHEVAMASNNRVTLVILQPHDQSQLAIMYNQ